MRPTGITTNINVPDIGEARSFYADYLGLSVEEMNLGWVARFTTPDGRAAVQLVSGDETAPVDSAISVHVGDEVDVAYEEATRRGFEIVHPLTTEPWGVRRFFVRTGRYGRQRCRPLRRSAVTGRSGGLTGDRRYRADHLRTFDLMWDEQSSWPSG